MVDLKVTPLAPAEPDTAQPDTVALFVSDLHLHVAMPRTAQAFFNFLQHQARRSQQLYLLGDIFEYWAGDDDIATPFNQHVVSTIRAISAAGVAVFWMAGNRDFLVGDRFAAATGVRLLPDPVVTQIAGYRMVLTHGDAQCTDDRAYMEFRARVRSQDWQQKFLALPLAERKAIIADLRSGSREAQRAKSSDIMDVNAGAIATLFDTTDTEVMIHGHTHRPACHRYPAHPSPRVRYVLPDWDCDAAVQRGGWIGISADGAIRRFDVNGHALS